MYQCKNSSKCISLNRLNDGIDDCMFSDDEDETLLEKQNLTEYFKQSHYQCLTSKKYIPGWTIDDRTCQCGFEEYLKCEDEPSDDLQVALSSFTIDNVCDGFTDSKSILIDGQIHTDETECENWPCDNFYTHCNEIWNCLNGEDELNCESFSSMNCSSNDHICKSKDDGHLICLSLEKVNNGISDCHGNIDESKICKRNMPSLVYASFQCQNPSMNRCIYPYEICDGINNCPDDDDEQFCYINFNTYKNVQLQLDSTANLDSNEFHCNQGFSLLVWLNKEEKLFQRVCFCPIHFYGKQCQYQNQQVNLYVKFQALYSSFYSIFQVIVLLVIDSNEQVIHSYKQFTFVKQSDANCQDPEYYLASLIYSTRPKDMLKNYSIHIHIYEKLSLSYRASFIIPIEYSFLPVHRIAKLVSIPRNNRSIRYCSHRQCNYHGKCILYLHQSQEKSFCQCEREWTGKFCSISYHCSCSSDSLCLGISAINRSVCVCPVNRTGVRCLTKDLSCQMDEVNPCENGGRCIPHRESFHGTYRQFSCVCREGFSGTDCSKPDSNITLSFEKEVILSSTLYIHLFRRLHLHVSYRTIIPVKISKNENSSVIYWQYQYDFVIVQSLSPDHYYFVGMTRKGEISSNLAKMINSSDRCLHLNEFLPEMIYKLDYLRRVKYYYLICERYSSNVSCFYDNDTFCKCDYFNEQHYPYCFPYQRNPALPKLNEMECYSGGELFQDDIKCPSRLWCVCPRCSFGAQCQFTTSGFGLSLESILSYHIQPHVNLTHQPALVQVTAGLSIIFLILGFINGVLSLLTFQNKIVCEVGCGIFLLVSSIITLFITIFFGLKVWILLLTQMSLIENRTFLTIQCYSINFLLQICLNTYQWLNAGVAYERAVCTIRGVRFNKNKSKRIAKVITTILVIFNIGTSIHDPIYRQLIEAENSFEGNDDSIPQLWCIINYKSSSLSIYNNIMNTFHFFGPFLVNFVSSVILITKKSLHRRTAQNLRNFLAILRNQFYEHKHLFLAPTVLVLLATPLLIITYTTKCMESEDDAWLYLVGYFISFISPMLTFSIFVVPSTVYTKALKKTIQQIRARS